MFNVLWKLIFVQCYADIGHSAVSCKKNKEWIQPDG